MAEKQKHWVHVVDKKTYACFIISIIGIIKLICYDFTLLPNISEVGLQVLISALLIILGIYLFVRMNSYSAWMNPDHPH